MATTLLTPTDFTPLVTQLAEMIKVNLPFILMIVGFSIVYKLVVNYIVNPLSENVSTRYSNHKTRNWSNNDWADWADSK